MREGVERALNGERQREGWGERQRGGGERQRERERDGGGGGGRERKTDRKGETICWLLNVPATCQCISGTDLLRQFYVLPHWDRSCRSNFPSHPVTVYWHRANQSQHWPYNARRQAGYSHWSANFEVTGMTPTLEKSRRKRESNPGSSALEADALTTGPRRRSRRDRDSGQLMQA